MKKKVMMCMMAALCLCSGMTAYAAPETMADGTVFDAEYYAQSNPDVVAEIGTDRDVLYNHYVMFGKNEGRLPYVQTTDTVQTESSVMKQRKELYIFPKWGDVGVLPNMSRRAESQVQINIYKPIKRKIDYFFNGRQNVYDYVYDSVGNLVKEIEYTDGEAIHQQKVYSYDEQGKLIRQDVYSADNSLWYWYDYSYDIQGNLISEHGHNCQSYMLEIREKNDYKYDASGKLEQKILYDYDGNIKGRHELSYDGLGRLIKDTEYFYYQNVDHLSGWIDYTYDSNGNMIKLAAYNHYDNGDDVLNMLYEFGYDGQGRIISEVGYDRGDIFRDRTTYSYDSEGDLIRADRIYNQDGATRKKWFEYIY